MNSFEVVSRAITFKRPERIPCNFGAIGHSDFLGVSRAYPTTKLSEQEEVDEWGCIWRKWRQKELIGEPVGHPLENWDSFKKFAWPDPDNPELYANVEAQLQKAGDRFVLAGIDGILRRARFLRGFTNLMMDFYLHPKRVKELIEKILEFSLKVLHNYSKFKGIHGISMPEDWGTQTQPFVRLPMLREFFGSVYQKLFETVHSYGWIMRMHSDGKINDLIEEFIDCGLDVIELEQPQALGIEEIGRRYRGRICFEGSIDIQATLPTENEELIRKEAKELIENWSTPEGGFIAVCYHGSDIGVSNDVLKVALEAFEQSWAENLNSNEISLWVKKRKERKVYEQE